MSDLGILGGDAGSWRELPDEELLAPPNEMTHALVDPLLGLLPTNEMSWPSFERLLKRVAREVEGLRAVQQYGVPGQAQDGIDIVGINPAGENEAVQGKRSGLRTKLFPLFRQCLREARGTRVPGVPVREQGGRTHPPWQVVTEGDRVGR